jgi:LCP family protein required for cell wall assembly
MVSAQLQKGDLAERVGPELEPGPFPLFGANTILVLGSDARTEGLAEPGATVGGPSRSDSIMLLRLGGGANASLSIPRDTVVDIPGSGTNKINAAYAIGGARLATRTVKQYLGIDVNHVVEVSFDNFPQLVDALGGVTVRTGCVISRINGGTSNGGYTLRLRRGENELNGEQALALARTRKNDCRPAEDDRTRARRQQQIVAAMKDKVTSFETFIRLPWVSWAAPRAVRSDMGGPTLLGVVGAALTGGTGHQAVLRPAGGVTLGDGGAGLIVDDATKERAVARFLRG